MSPPFSMATLHVSQTLTMVANVAHDEQERLRREEEDRRRREEEDKRKREEEDRLRRHAFLVLLVAHNSALIARFALLH